MNDPVTADLASLDRLVARAALALRDGAPDVLEGVYRDAARQSTFDALAAIDHPLAPHVAALTIARVIGNAVEVALAEPTQLPSELPRGVTSGHVSVDGALLEVTASSSLEASRAWLEVAARASTRASDAASARAEIEEEAAKRLRAVPDGALVDRADAFLDRTADLAASIAREPAAFLSIASARSAGDGWPRKPSIQFLLEAFGSDVKAKRTIERIAERARSKHQPTIVVGASTHMRSLAAWAFDWHARMPGDRPFAERHDPQWTAAHGSALLVSSALASVPFQRRALGLGDRVARAQARALDTSRLVAARMAAARLLAPDAERGERLFGRAIDPKLRRILPRPKRDERGRFRAWLDLASLSNAARSTHDEDWFRNPRFWEEMAIRFASPPDPSELPSSDALAAMFVERLA